LYLHKYLIITGTPGGIAGFSNYGVSPSLYENTANPHYEDNINFNFNYPNNYNNPNPKYNKLRKAIELWRANNPPGTIIEYYRPNNKESCHMDRIKIVGYTRYDVLLCPVNYL